MRSLDEIRALNARFEDKELYQAVERLKTLNRTRRAIREARQLRAEMRNNVADIKAANTVSHYRLKKDDIKATLAL